MSVLLSGSWMEEVFTDLREGSGGGFRALNAVSSEGGFVLFSRENKSFKITARSENFKGSYEFLEKEPDVWTPVLEMGSLELPGSSSVSGQRRVWLAVDRLHDPDYLVVAELPGLDRADAPGNLLRFALISDVYGRLDQNESVHMPSWLNPILSGMDKKTSPLFIVSEPGSGAADLINAFLLKKFGSEKSVYFFSPGRLSEAVQLRELFGDAAGARLGDPGSVKSVVERDLVCIVVKEAGALSMAVQKRILSVLESGSSVFWIFETSRNLAAMSEEREFLPQLEKKLDREKILLPPLRNCRLELIGEAAVLLSRYNKLYGRKVELHDSAKTVILSYDWPGNWDQFKSVLECSYAMCSEGLLMGSDLRFFETDESEDWGDLNMRRRIEDFERSLILKAYSLHGGNQVQMSRSLGISRGSLQYKMSKYHLSE